MPKTARRPPVATIPLDLMASTLVSNLRGRARIVLSVMLAKTFGPESQSRVRLSPTALSRLTGLHQTSVSDGIRDLLEAGIIDGSFKEGYTLNRGWLPPKDKYGGKLRQYCLDTAATK